MPEVSCILGKSNQTNSGMQKHINNWWILPAVFWVQICPMPRAINSFLAAKDRRALNTLQKALGTWQKNQAFHVPAPRERANPKVCMTAMVLSLNEGRQPPGDTASCLQGAERSPCLRKLHLLSWLLKKKKNTKLSYQWITRKQQSIFQWVWNAGKILPLMRHQRCLKAGTWAAAQESACDYKKFLLP